MVTYFRNCIELIKPDQLVKPDQANQENVIEQRLTFIVLLLVVPVERCVAELVV